jgi:hypothetical protein
MCLIKYKNEVYALCPLDYFRASAFAKSYGGQVGAAGVPRNDMICNRRIHTTVIPRLDRGIQGFYHPSSQPRLGKAMCCGFRGSAFAHLTISGLPPSYKAMADKNPDPTVLSCRN